MEGKELRTHGSGQVLVVKMKKYCNDGSQKTDGRVREGVILRPDGDA